MIGVLDALRLAGGIGVVAGVAWLVNLVIPGGWPEPGEDWW